MSKFKIHNYFVYSLITLLIVLNSFFGALGSNPKVYTVNDGLSINEINGVYQDREMQFIWLYTQNGLNRYNGHGFQKYYIERNGATTSNFISSVAEDSDGNLWLATKKGLACLNYQNNTWQALPKEFETGYYKKICRFNDQLLFGIKNDSILVQIEKNSTCMEAIPNLQLGLLNDIVKVEDMLLLATSNGLFNYDTKSKSIERIEVENATSCLQIKFLPHDEAVWARLNKGWFRIPVTGKNLNVKQAKRYFGKLTTLEGFTPVKDVVFDGETYFGAMEQGIISFKLEEKKLVKAEVLNEWNDYAIKELYFDNCQNLWASCWLAGAVKIPKTQSPFSSYRQDDKSGLSSKLIRGFCELDDKHLLVASETVGLLIFDTETEKFSSCHTPANRAKFGSFPHNGNIIHLIKKDAAGRIWCAYHKDGFNVVYGKDREEINHNIQKHVPGFRICHNFHFDLDNEKVYIATKDKVLVYNLQSGTFSNLKYQGNNFNSMLLDSENNFWIGGRGGLGIYNGISLNANKIFEQKLIDSGLKNEDIICLLSDSQKNIWIGTYGNGLYIYKTEDGSFHKVPAETHQHLKVVFSIIEANDGTLWLGTNNGLFNFNQILGKFKRYSIEDGIQDNQFNYRSAYKTQNGRLYFGGINGITSFHPQYLPKQTILPKPVLYSLLVDNTQQNLVEKIKIPFSKNSFEFSFFTPNFTNPENYVYAYSLVGHTNDYQICPANSPRAGFTNVPPGIYHLEVKVSRPNSDWSEITQSPVIIVLPPWYLSPLAYVIYALLLVFVFVLTIRITRKQANYRNSLEIARLEREKTEQVSQAKLRFFTDVAHEIRTPLTLIVDPLNDLLSNRKFDNPAQKSLELMQRSSKRLMSLMDELLLFRKAETGNLPLNLKEENITAMVANVCSLFEQEAASKDISINREGIDEITHVFDQEKLEKVATNLLNNALKFTSASGTITVSIKQNEKGIKLIVSDTGKGISADDLNAIFNRFYQSENQTGKGFGIGLTLSKRIVEAHHGTLTAKSTVGKGSTFKVFIPKLTPNVSSSKPENRTIQKSISTDDEKASVFKTNLKGNVLIIEDDDEIRNYITSIFEQDFDVVCKENGMDGFEHTKKNLPDIVITDFQMPEMDGITMCKKIKEEMLTSHIPVVLLSAFNEIEDQLSGFEVGADDYIGKPFHRDILLHKVSNILQSRQQLIKSFQVEKKVNISQFEKPDQRFLERVNKIIFSEMDNEGFDIPVLCDKIGLGKTALNNKLKSMLGVTPAQYIKKTKLKEAYRLITEKGKSPSEAAYAISYSPTYFATSFKKEFGVAPSEV